MDKVIYVKISDNRAREFQAETIILKTNSGNRIFKKALYPEGQEHLKKVKDNEGFLKSIYKDKAYICKSELKDDTLEFEYIEGVTLENKLSDVANFDDIVKILDIYHDLVHTMDNKPSINADLILSNIIMQDDRYVIVDYEWLINTGLTTDFIFWRGLFTSVAFSKLDKDTKKKIYDRYGLAADADDTYIQDEVTFQNYVRGDAFTLHGYAEEVPCKVITINQLNSELTKTKIELDKTGESLKNTTEQLDKANNELEIIKNSKSWKALKKLHIVKG